MGDPKLDDLGGNDSEEVELPESSEIGLEQFDDNGAVTEHDNDPDEDAESIVDEGEDFPI